ncbi:MAG: TonB-dependent receptor [Alphaproteobacteria bacterium]|nr:TonB-dependent receptor [Alphaproteobacteria bacterium]MDE2111771.1 TonB-dependent receptor [Alphaproteobacteria bacterium]
MALPVTPAVAQDTGGAMETVVVTGIRSSLQRSLDIKRDAAGLVDAITMEDIGKFPDANLAAALMRVPGVTVTRAGALGGTVTTGQPTEITVRGFGPSFNETLFEGRRIPSATGGRAFDFSGLSADMVSELQVLKSPDATLSAGAIGATINVIYPKPFDYDGLRVAAAVSGGYMPDDGRITPNGNFLISDTFANGKLGILFAGAYSSLATTQQQFSNWGWIGQMCTTSVTGCVSGGLVGKPVWFTQDYSIDYNQIREEKTNARIAVQFQPNEALLITVDGNYARDNVHEQQWAYAIWNNFGEMTNITTSKYGTITDFTRHAPTDFDANENWGIQQTYDVGINIKYNVNSHFSLMGDVDQSLSVLNPGKNHFSAANMDVGYGPSQGACSNIVGASDYNANCAVANYAGGTNGMNVGVIQPGDHKIPYYTGIGPNGDITQFLNTNIMGSHVMVVQQFLNRNLVNQAKLEGQWSEDNLTVKFGGQYVQDHYKLDGNDDFWGNQWQIYSGYGPDSQNYFNGNPLAPAGVHLPSSLFTGTINVRTIPGWTTVSSIPGLPKFSRAAAYAYIGGLGTPTSGTPGAVGFIPGFNWSCCGNGSGGTIYKNTQLGNMVVHDNNSFQQVFEDTYSFYMTASTGAHLAGMPLKINAGVRYEYTDVTSSGLFSPLSKMVIDAADHTAYDFSYDPSTVIRVPSSYQYLLPNLDLVLQATDDLQFRFDASRTLTRPNLGSMTPNTSYGGRTGSLTANSGNPTLQPFLSDNLDVSAEWYYAPNSYLSGDVFLKNVTNFVVNGTTSLTFPSSVDANVVVDPYTGKTAVFALTSPLNGPKANVYGIELAWQHVFGDSGFGYQINGTIVGTNKPYDPYNLTSSAFAVTGLADSANFVAFYDKEGFEFRVAANWRDTYLDHFGQSQNGTSFGIEPTYVNTAWAIDLSTSYDITNNLNAYFEVNNLLDQAYSTRGRFPDQIVDVVSYGRRFTLGLHYKL